MRIGKAAKETGISAKMIRYYESIGLLPPAQRLASGYRAYGSSDIDLLRLIRRARDAGLSPEQAGELARLCQKTDRAKGVRTAKALLAELEGRAAAAGELARRLRHFIRARTSPFRTPRRRSSAKRP